MATTNENKTREITNNFTGTATQLTFAPSSQTAREAGIVTISITFTDATNEIELAVQFVDDDSENRFFSEGYVTSGSLLFDNLVDLGASHLGVQDLITDTEEDFQRWMTAIMSSGRIEITY